MSTKLTHDDGYQKLVTRISDVYTTGRVRAEQSVNKVAILKLASQGQIIEQPSDLLRNPFVFEFLKIPEPHALSETDLEGRLCDHLQPFLLELGKGFTFVGRQYRITINNTHYHVDLVFYHRILRCFVLIDLKLDDLQHYDIGQMNLYLGYFAAEENVAGDNPPIGIILTRHKDELLVEYATYGMNSQLSRTCRLDSGTPVKRWNRAVARGLACSGRPRFKIPQPLPAAELSSRLPAALLREFVTTTGCTRSVRRLGRLRPSWDS